jgi:putative oxidoreductase
MFMQRYERQAFALLRIIAGFLFLWHGSQKLLDFPPSGGTPPLHILLIAGPIELLGGLLIMLGLGTRWVAFLASGQMAYAYWTAHAPNGLLPIVNHGEMAVLYCFVFLFIAAHGAGIWSMDNLLTRRKE